MQKTEVRDLLLRFEHYLKAAEAGETIEILDNGLPIALLSPPKTGRRPVFQENQLNEIPVSERFAHLFKANSAEAAMEGLAAIQAEIVLVKNAHESLLHGMQDLEDRSLMMMQKAQNQELDPVQADNLIMGMLRKQELLKQQAQHKSKELSELEYLRSQMQELTERLKNFKADYRKKVAQMPDSSETISMIERMKAKIAKEEILSDMYAQEAENGPVSPEAERKIDEILGVNRQKREQDLNDLKAKLGIKKE